MKHSVLALLVLLGVVAVLFFTFRLGTTPEEPSPEGAEGSGEVTAPEQAETAPPELVEPTAEPADSSEARAELALPEELDPDAFTLVRGRVVLPAGCAADDTLEVFAVDRARDYRWLARRLDGTGDPELDVADPFLARRSVAADGSFTLPFPPDAERGYVMLRGRYLYLYESEWVELDVEAPAVTLTPRTGARLVGRIVTPAGGPDDVADVAVGVRTSEDDINPDDTDKIRVEVRTDATGGFEVRAIPVHRALDISVKHERLAYWTRPVAAFEPCTDREVEARLVGGGRIVGRVVDDSSAAIEGATAQAVLPGQWFGFDGLVVREAETDESGAFVLEGVTAGKLQVRAKSHGFLESQGEKVDLTEGGEVDGLVIELGEGNAVSGHVHWEDGRPADDVLVHARFDIAHMTEMGVFNALRGAENQTQTLEDGSFRLTGLGGGPFVVTSVSPVPLVDGDAPGQAEGDAVGEAEDEPPTIVYTARVDDVSPGREGLRLVLRPPLGVHGRVVDQDGIPVQGEFTVHAGRLADGPFGALDEDAREETFHTESGRFFLSGFVEGSWELHVSGGHVTLEGVPVTPPAGSPEDPIVITAFATATVKGTVLSPDGEPVDGARVGVDTGGSLWQRDLGGGPDPPEARTRNGGQFTLEGITPVRSNVTAMVEDWARSAPETLDLMAGQTVEGVTLTLTLGGTLTGEVYAASGDRAAGQLIVATNLGTMQPEIAMTDADGEFRMEHLDPGGWQIISMDRSQEWEVGEEGLDIGSMISAIKMSQAEIVEGEVTHVVIGAPAADPVRVYGRVTLDDEPYEGAMMSFYPEGSGIYERLKIASLDDDGEYEIILDGPGEYLVGVGKLAGGPGQQSSIELAREIPEVEEYRLDIEMPLGRISGRVVGPDGEPAKGARVTLTVDGPRSSASLMGGQYSEISAEENGSFDIVGLRPGTYQIGAGGAAPFVPGAKATYGRVIEGGLRLDEDEWLEGIVVRLPAPGSLLVDVVDLDGSPAAGASVFLRDSGGRSLEPLSFSTTDASGRAKIVGLAPGEYTALARSAAGVSTESTPFKVREGETANAKLRLEEGAIVWVVLQRKDDDTPIKASVRVVDSEGREMSGLIGLQDLQALYSAGSFSPNETRVGPLPPGKYRVYAEADGLKAQKPITLIAGTERKVTVRLK